MKDYYAVLGVEREASPEQIRKAYRQLAKKFHPDVNRGDPQAEARFKQVHEAYSALGNPELRAAYDQQQSRSSTNRQEAGAAASSTAPKKSGYTNNGPINAEKEWSDPSRMQEQFEQFFGYRPKGKENSNRGKADPDKGMDMSAMFDRYFGVRKK
ncbi:DnaJ domain-containing protein [Paenibacillus silvae]|uniref:DnaJ domain-containing protein n=1 Tax=Paenibacillus silvae TaxID=1325358 RepID=UPI0011A706D8|nr:MULTISPECIES: DnaJ domain-containing protein [Paenibacillus]MCK6075278.1 DnaJ domain-containing protein [Paenibacillus silvae]MCK6149665.1 DnaJ domain-containing protein [Paenibacillus silvae]MCK6267963.1 DnaJ domain-containing protein [Paenibacillus silvae]